MSPLLAGIFALVIAAAGWFYLFYSKAATQLAGIEEQAINQRRIRLRRVGGFLMILLAMTMYIGVATGDSSPAAFVLIWLLVLILVGLVTLLALIDLRLTNQLRQRRKKERQ